ncbi:hypothetical protein FRB99_001391, partial [Tulasnella sp. 403]
MDELIYDCLKQIAFDGDLGVKIGAYGWVASSNHPPGLIAAFVASTYVIPTSFIGCDIGRLGTFIDDYYKNHSYIGSQRQCVDESFQSFVWSLIVQEASVTVGLVPEGSSPVYIAPQPSAVRKRKKAQSESIPQSTQDPSHSTPWTLELLDTTEVFGTNLSQLREKYGSTLRIAVDHNTSYAAITGSHVRSAKLGAMAYTMLQFITRSRTEGMSMTALGAATGYDQKTIHYLAAQLLDLDLILKIRTRGISKHTCIHKYFYAKSPFYVPEQEMQKKNTKDSDVVDKDEETNEQDAPTGHSIFANDPFDTRMIGNDTFIRQRLITLLRSTPNGFYPSGNLLPALKDEDDTEGPPKPPRKGGRKRKAEEVMDAQHDAAGPVAPMVPTEQVPEQGDRQEDLETLPPARKRRRVEKPTQRTSEAPKKRGRPRKSATASAPAPLAAMDADTPSPAIGIQPQPELNDIRAEMTPVESPVTAGPGSARPAERQALPEISGVAIQQQPRQQLSEQTAAQPPRRPLEPPVDKAAPEKRVRNTEPTVEPRSPSLAPVSESGVPHGTDRLSEQPQIQNIAAISSQPRGLAVNVSYMRREKEILHLLNESNGVALINLDFLRRHMGLLDEWAKDGRQTSAPPGTLTDKRTLNVLFETMEERKLVKVTKTVIPEAGANRRAPVMVVALVGTPESALIQLLESLKAPGEQSQARSLVRKKAKEQPIVDAELVERTPQEVRMELLNDPKTAAQLFGFIDGRVARVREMYLFTLSRLMDPTTSSEFFLSKQHRILDVQYFWTDLPLSTYCSLVSAPQYYPALEEALSTEQGRAQQVGDVPSHLAGILKAKRARSRFKLYEMLDLLKHLGLVTALERSIGRNPLIAIPAHGGDQGLSLNVVSGDGPSTTIEPR